MDHRTDLPPTLDPQRADQLRTFLTVEAAADAAQVRDRSAHPGRRRLVGGLAAAVALGSGLVAVASVAGGPSSGPASVQTAHAVTIEQSAPGWTRITIADLDADPDAVVAELRAAGIEARRDQLPVERDADGRVTLRSFDQEAFDAQQGGGGFSVVGLDDVGDGGLAGLTVAAPNAGPAPLSEGLSGEEAGAAFRAYLDELGAGLNADGSVELRNDADVTVVVLSEG